MRSARSWLTVLVAVTLLAGACASGDGDPVSSPDGATSAPSTLPEPPVDDAPSGEPELSEPPADDAPSGEPALSEPPVDDAPSGEPELPEPPVDDAPSGEPALPEPPADDPPPEETAAPADSQTGGIEDPTDPDDSAQADEPLAPEPEPAGLEVLRLEVVDSRGGVVAGGVVEVRVPAGAVAEPVDVEIRAPLGTFGTEVGGAVVGIEHAGPLVAPVAVSWDVSALSDEQQQRILVVRWDEDVGGWLPVDVDYEIVDGVLTAAIQEWSFWTWISDKLADFSQEVLEIFGRRVDAPECSGRDLPGWVTEASEPEEGANSAAIRLCYEPGDGETVTMRMVNNRTFSQYVYVDPPGVWDEDVVGPAPSMSIVGVLYQAANLAFTDAERLFMPPLTGAAVSIPRPQGGIARTIEFHRDHTFRTFLIDVVFFTVAHIDVSIGRDIFPYATQFVRLVFECTAERVEETSVAGLAVVTAIMDEALSCVGELIRPGTRQNSKLIEALAENRISQSHIGKSLNAQVFRKAKGLSVLTVAEAISNLIDLAAETFVDATPWRIRGQGRIARLGDWDPTCTHAAADSNQLHRHLLYREPFPVNRPGDLNLHSFDEWEPYAKRAVAPLEDCDDGHKVAVAADVMTWFDGDEARANRVVRDLIRAMVPPDPTGGYIAVAAGDDHSCGLHVDGRVACWGNNDFRQLHEPAGLYIAIAAGDEHTCGIRADQTLACWGLNNYGQTDAPDGRYIVISAGGAVSCGLRADRTMSCWGDNEATQADAQDGQYIGVAAGGIHTCALRAAETISCWGASNEERLDEPEGKFTAITAAFWHSCGLRLDLTITCWGDNLNGRTDAPAGQFTAISASFTHTCALRTDQTIACWGSDFDGQTDLPEGKYTDVSAGRAHTCAVRTDQTITCWGDNESGQTDAPTGPPPTEPLDEVPDAPDSAGPPMTTGPFAAISAGGSHSCGVRADATIACWGYNYNGQLDAPEGLFSAVAAGARSSCGLRTDGTITCWGGLLRQSADAPNGGFADVYVGYYDTCGLRGDATVTCWQWSPSGQVGPPLVAIPNDTFDQLGFGDKFWCGLHTDGTITCSGTDNRYGQTNSPSGRFAAIAVGGYHSCGLRDRWRRHLLGLQRIRYVGCAGGTVHRHQRRRGAFVRDTRRWHPPLLGQQRHRPTECPERPIHRRLRRQLALVCVAH